MKKLFLVAAAFIIMSAALLTSCQQPVDPVVPELSQDQQQQTQEASKTDAQATSPTAGTSDSTVSEFTLSFNANVISVYIIKSNGRWVYSTNGSKVNKGEGLYIDVNTDYFSAGKTLDKIVINGKSYDGPTCTITSIDSSYANGSIIEISCTERDAQSIKYTFDSAKMSVTYYDNGQSNTLTSGSTGYEGRHIVIHPTLTAGKVVDKWIIAGTDYSVKNVSDEDNSNRRSNGLDLGIKDSHITVSNKLGSSVSIDLVTRDAESYTVTFGDNILCASDCNGSNQISKNSIVQEGDTLYFCANIPTGKVIDKWIINGNEQINNRNTLFTIYELSSDYVSNNTISVEVSFRDAQTYTLELGPGITCQKYAQGIYTNTPTNSVVSEGDNLVFSYTPDAGKILNKWKVNGVEVMGYSGNSCSVTVSSSHISNGNITVAVTERAAKIYTISFGNNITCTKKPNDDTVNNGDTLYEGTIVSFYPTITSGKTFKNWKCNGTIISYRPTYDSLQNVQVNSFIFGTDATDITISFTEE